MSEPIIDPNYDRMAKIAFDPSSSEDKIRVLAPFLFQRQYMAKRLLEINDDQERAYIIDQIEYIENKIKEFLAL